MSCSPFIMISLFLFFTSMLLFLNVTSISPSQSTGTDNSALVISLKAVAFRSDAGNAGIASSMVAVEDIVELLAHCTFIGSCFIFVPGHKFGTKCPVAAVSGYAIMFLLFILHEVGFLSVS